MGLMGNAVHVEADRLECSGVGRIRMDSRRNGVAQGQLSRQVGVGNVRVIGGRGVDLRCKAMSAGSLVCSPP